MKQIIFNALCIISGSLFLANPKLSLNPFSFKIERPYMAAGFILFAVGLVLMATSQFNQGRGQGQKDVFDVIEQNKKTQNQNASGSDTGK